MMILLLSQWACLPLPNTGGIKVRWIRICEHGVVKTLRFPCGRVYDSSFYSSSTWLCGGRIMVARDSFVAHAFRSRFPYRVCSFILFEISLKSP